MLKKRKLTFASIPMQESFSSEHGSKLFANALEQFLDGSRVSNEGGGHFQASGRDVTNGSLNIIRDPFDKVGAVLVLDVEELFIHLLHRHPSSEDAGNSEVAAVPGVAGRHHVPRVEHLLGQLRHRQGSG